MFFDDVALGSNDLEQHQILLREFLKTCQTMYMRIKLSKCQFAKTTTDYLGFTVGTGWWRPTDHKIAALQSAKITNLKDLRRFLGACNFCRRHIRNFSHTSAILTDLLKKGAKFDWTQEHEDAFQELKAKIAAVTCLGVPKEKGEVIIITDASDVGGGAQILQWQQLKPQEKQEVQEFYSTTGVNRDGTLKHNYNEDAWQLVPLGYFNWKWNPTRQNYATYEQELLAGILAIGSQQRIVGHLPIVWLCDQQAAKAFIKNPAPENSRLRRWWTFLSQLRLTIFHLPGVKNELCDYLSRELFNEKYSTDIEAIAKEAFQRMDVHLDLRLEALDKEDEWRKEDYMPEYREEWDLLKEGESKTIQEQMFWRNDQKMYCETKLVIPIRRLQEVILWVHQSQGHLSVERTAWFIQRHYYTKLHPKQLLETIKEILKPCRICAEAKPNTASDRGLIGALPTPSTVNNILYVDFIAMDMYDNYDYVMTICDSLSRFARFIPCRKTATGEKVFQMIWENWIQVYGRPVEIHSDNDIRFQGEHGWWQGCLKALKIKVTFSTPRRPQANGLCEVMNKKFIQTMRILMAQQKSRNWLRLVPYCTFVLNNQYQPSTGSSPSDIFFGRPSWQADAVPNPELAPACEEWLTAQLSMQEDAKKRIQHIREQRLKRANKGRSLAHYQEGQYVLIHKRRFPQWPLTKLGSQWFGPYRITHVKSQSVEVRASPSLGGVVDVAFTFLKHWPESMIQQQRRMMKKKRLRRKSRTQK